MLHLCDPHQGGQRAELYFPSGISGPAFLTLWLSDKKVTVELTRRVARLLLMLHEARHQDALIEADELARGWRSRTWIAEEVGSRNGYPIEEATLSAYVSQLLRALSRAVSRFSTEAFELIERRRGLGFRLAPNLKLTISDGNRRSDSDRSEEQENS